MAQRLPCGSGHEDVLSLTTQSLNSVVGTHCNCSDASCCRHLLCNSLGVCQNMGLCLLFSVVLWLTDTVPDGLLPFYNTVKLFLLFP